MTNGEKYKTPEERVKAFNAFCEKQPSCEKCLTIRSEYSGAVCIFFWLNLEADEEAKLLPCPFCGGEAHVLDCTEPFVQCSKCEVHTNCYSNKSEAVASWNRRVK